MADVMDKSSVMEAGTAVTSDPVPVSASSLLNDSLQNVKEQVQQQLEQQAKQNNSIPQQDVSEQQQPQIAQQIMDTKQQQQTTPQIIDIKQQQQQNPPQQLELKDCISTFV